MDLSRRTLLGVGSAAALLAATYATDAFAERGAAQIVVPDGAMPHRTVGGFNMGCQAWSFNHYTVLEAIDKTAEVGGVTIEFFPGQKIGGAFPENALDPSVNDDALGLIKDHLAKANIRAVAFGVTGLSPNEAEDRKTFELAKKLGLNTIVSEPNPDAMDTIEKLVKEYDIRVAIHNHPKHPGYKHWDPEFTLSLVKGRDRRIGSCSDTGHWVRSGIRPVNAMKILKGRILEVHLKDLNEFSPNGHDVPFGTGVSDIPAVLAELRRQRFDGNISIEYEYDWTTSVPEIAQSIGFVRGWGAMKG